MVICETKLLFLLNASAIFCRVPDGRRSIVLRRMV